jgi:hypothetical protein
MIYNKPELVVSASSIKAIQSGLVKGSSSYDNNMGSVHGTPTATATAYEADE